MKKPPGLDAVDYLIVLAVLAFLFISISSVSTLLALLTIIILPVPFLISYLIKSHDKRMKARQTHTFVKSGILELKSKIKFFKMKGIGTDELELVLGKIEKRMINKTPPR